MNYLYFDTETNGFTRKPGTPLSQCPHIVQLAALLTDSDGSEISCMDALIQPDGWTVPDSAVAVHGITTAKAVAWGRPLWAVMRCFMNLHAAADVLVGHNIQFDLKMVGYELARLGLPMPGKRACCTMEAATGICELAGNGRNYKFPKLIEVHRHFFGEGFSGAHGALADTRACARVHRHMLDQHLI